MKPLVSRANATFTGKLPLSARPPAHHDIAQRVRSGDYARALEQVAKTLRKAPDDTEALHLAFLAHSGLRQWQPALEQLERLLTLNPRSSRWARAKALTLSNARRYRAALPLATSLLKGPDDVHMLDLLNVCHFNLKNHDRALVYGQMALRAKDLVALKQSNAATAATTARSDTPAGYFWRFLVMSDPSVGHFT